MEITLKADDGYALGATVFGSRGRAVLVMPATGVPQSYYAKYAAYLAERGFMVLTFDYRGIGRSRNGDIRASSARMRDWALLDAAAAARYLGGEIAVVGHSFGGQALGLLPEPGRITAALLVGAQSGYWRHWPAHRPAGSGEAPGLLPRLAPGLRRGPAARRGARMGELVPPPALSRRRARRRGCIRTGARAGTRVCDQRRSLRAVARRGGARQPLPELTVGNAPACPARRWRKHCRPLRLLPRALSR
ncbi:MAG: alpha/beta hydrolase [Betaproteobacteria bacterium]|nr:MAG: alpha/beta hydrolase [Betaproteobacteria bacterium]